MPPTAWAVSRCPTSRNQAAFLTESDLFVLLTILEDIADQACNLII
jgi:hypothetical protein